jgi:UDP-glucose 4-epimerase
LNNQALLKKNKKIRCLVLGANGFIGWHLVNALIEQEYSLTLFNRYNINPYPAQQPIKYIEGDLTNAEDVANALVDCNICFHLISTVEPKSSNVDPIFDINTNLVSTVNLLNQAVKEGIKKIIFISSGGTVYGNPKELPITEEHPTNPLCSYGIIKLTIEKYLDLYFRLHNLDYTILRVSNAFGLEQKTQPRNSVITVFLKQALSEVPVTIWGDGTIIRDYIHVSDVVSALLKTITYTGSTKVFNIGSGFGMSLNEVLDHIECLVKKKIHRIYSTGRKFDVTANVLAINRAMNELEWSPKASFTDSLQHMLIGYAS